MKPFKLTLITFFDKSYAFIAALIISICIVFAPKSSNIFLPALTFICLIRAPIDFVKNIFKPLIFIPLFLFFAWSFSSIFWSLAPEYAIKSVSIAFLLALATLGLTYSLSKISRSHSDQTILFLCNVFYFALAIWAIELLSDGMGFKWISHLKGLERPPYGIDIAYKSTAFIMGGCSLLLGGWFLSQKRYLWGITLLLMIFLLSLASRSTTAFIGTFIGGTVLVLCLYLPRFVGWATLIVTACVNLTLPMVLYLLPISDYTLRLHEKYGDKIFSLYHRTIIWEFTLDKWIEKPFTGWGVASSRVIPGSEMEIEYAARVLSLHSHNHLLQAGLELGIIGCFLYTALLICILWKIHIALKSPPARAIAFGLFTALYVFGSSEHSLWHHWWLAWVGVLIGLAALICSRIEASQTVSPPDLNEDQR